MLQNPNSDIAHARSPRGLLAVIGIIGTALPFVLAFGNMFLEGPGIQKSVSAYYYTGMRNIFVGSLCAIAVLILTYRGHKGDYFYLNLASIFAFGVAFFPTTPEIGATSREEIIGTFHLLFAAFFFLMLAIITLRLFRKTHPNKPPTPRKELRNGVYTFCGYSILACIALLAILKFMPDSPVNSLNPVFWLESIAVAAFGVAWLTKGELILADQTLPGSVDARAEIHQASNV
jgi:protein-S-isoprenylcysteine O-methyltransferase Ste14